MDIKNTLCRLADLTKKQVHSLRVAMPDSDYFDFHHRDEFIGFAPCGATGTFHNVTGPTIVTYTEMMQLIKR